MTFKESFIAKVITIEWYNLKRDLIGLKEERKCLELFEKELGFTACMN
jgi:hypothetical protein